MSNTSSRVLFVMMMIVGLPAAAREPQRVDPSKFDPPRPLEPIERFNGTLSSPTARAVTGPRAVVQQWGIANRQRVEIPHEGFLVVEVRGGEFVSVVGGNRVRHGTDDFFAVPRGQRFVVETERDSVSLHTVDMIVAKDRASGRRTGRR